MSSLLLWTRSDTWRTHIVQAMTEMGHQVLVCEQTDQVVQAVLADVYEGVLVDECILSESSANPIRTMLTDLGFQGQLLVLSGAACEGEAISEIVHIDAVPTTQQLQALSAYFGRRPASKWAGLTFDSMPGFQEIQARYKAKLPAQLKALQRAFDDKAWVDLQRQAHAIKGGAGSFGLERLTELTAQLDRAARGCDEAEAARCLALIQSEFGGEA